MKQTKIIAKHKTHLKRLIDEEIKRNGAECSLNHIDMSHLFNNCRFNGDISNWNTSKVTNMAHMFSMSDFTGDVSQWDNANVEDMNHMFCKTKFNKNLSKFNTSNSSSQKAKGLRRVPLSYWVIRLGNLTKCCFLCSKFEVIIICR